MCNTIAYNIFSSTLKLKIKVVLVKEKLDQLLIVKKDQNINSKHFKMW